jgi:hypothetical protein
MKMAGIVLLVLTTDKVKGGSKTARVNFAAFLGI